MVVMRDYLHKAKWEAAVQFVLSTTTTLRTFVRESPACICNDSFVLIVVKVSLVPRPSNSTVFHCLQYTKTEGEGQVYFIRWIVSVFTLVDRGVPHQKNKLENIHELKEVPFMVWNEECVSKMCSFNWWPLPPLSTWIDTNVIHVIKYTSPLPLDHTILL